jgi:hypothetical protein
MRSRNKEDGGETRREADEEKREGDREERGRTKTWRGGCGDEMRNDNRGTPCSPNAKAKMPTVKMEAAAC